MIFALSLSLLVLCSVQSKVRCFEGRADEDGAPWNYDDYGDSWGDNYEDCKGANQSPIDINVEYEPNWSSRLKFRGYDIPRTGMVLINKGYTVQLELGENSEPACISGDILGDEEYCFQQLHFHWGLNDDEGSEHTFDGQASMMEMHLVHTSTTAPKPGIAVLGVLFKYSYFFPSFGYLPITNNLDEVTHKGQSVVIDEPITLSRLLPRSWIKHLHHYNGSLTTPPCTEGVLWNVYENHVRICHTQMEEFRNLLRTAEGDTNSKPIAPNFRRTQNLNEREVSEYNWWF